MKILLRPLQRESVYGGDCKHWRVKGDTFEFFTAAFGEQRKVLFLLVVVWHVEVQYLSWCAEPGVKPTRATVVIHSSFGNS